MNSLEVKFIGVEPISGMKGTLKAMRSGKYMLELSDRKIISDGHTIGISNHPERMLPSMQSRIDPQTHLISYYLIFFTIINPKRFKSIPLAIRCIMDWN